LKDESTIQVPGGGLLRREVWPDGLGNSDGVARRDSRIHIWQEVIDFKHQDQCRENNGKQGQAASTHGREQADHRAAADSKCPDASDAARGAYT
jgi:hypothetical protein